MRIPALAVCLLTSSLAAQRPAPAALPRDLDAYVARVMKDFEVPGIGLTVVKDGGALPAKGYGVRKLGAPTPVDDHTLFGIALRSPWRAGRAHPSRLSARSP